MNNIVERLRAEYANPWDGNWPYVMHEAAEEIERLLAQNDLLATGVARREAEIERLTAALQSSTDVRNHFLDKIEKQQAEIERLLSLIHPLKIARAELGGKP